MWRLNFEGIENRKRLGWPYRYFVSKLQGDPIAGNSLGKRHRAGIELQQANYEYSNSDAHNVQHGSVSLGKEKREDSRHKNAREGAQDD